MDPAGKSARSVPARDEQTTDLQGQAANLGSREDQTSALLVPEAQEGSPQAGRTPRPEPGGAAEDAPLSSGSVGYCPSASGPASFSHDDIQGALERILGSEEFSTVTQLRAFLDYVVTCELNGTPEGIKGYTIAVEALGRDVDFNPISDPIVRVEAARLRRRLAMYYEGSGRDDQVIIHIPKGSYAPQICSRSAATRRTGGASAAAEGGTATADEPTGDGSLDDPVLAVHSPPDGPLAFETAERQSESIAKPPAGWFGARPILLAFSACLIFFAGFLAGRF